MRAVICAAVLIVCGLALPVRAQQPGQGAVPVGTVTAERKPIGKSLAFVGRVEAIERVDVKARITGYLEEVLFKEGATIQQGNSLYHIEKGLFEAAVEQAEGALARSKAAKVLTEVQLQRAEDLYQKQTGTAVARDQARAADDQAKGAVMTDEANLQTAKINLGYTDIVSPISGKVGRTNITKGNVVGPETGVLTTIVSQDPMYVSFPVSQRDFLRVQEAGQKIETQSITARIRFSNGVMYDRTGRINFINVTVDRSTDTVLVRASFPNPAEALIDGQLVQVVLEGDKPEEKVVVPQAALIADQEGIYVFAVEDGKAVVKRVKTGGESGADVVVEQGLSGGEQIIVEGLQGVRAGIAVTARPLFSSLGRS